MKEKSTRQQRQPSAAGQRLSDPDFVVISESPDGRGGIYRLRDDAPAKVAHEARWAAWYQREREGWGIAATEALDDHLHHAHKHVRRALATAPLTANIAGALRVAQLGLEIAVGELEEMAAQRPQRSRGRPASVARAFAAAYCAQSEKLGRRASARELVFLAIGAGLEKVPSRPRGEDEDTAAREKKWWKAMRRSVSRQK